MPTRKEGKIYYTPDELGYEDRGKLKWMGMMLSDHTEALKQLKKSDTTLQKQTVKPQQSMSDISKFLYESFIYQKPILVQANIIQDGHHYQTMAAIAMGQKDAYVYLKQIDGQESKCQVEAIRHIEWMDPAEWYRKQPLDLKLKQG